MRRIIRILRLLRNQGRIKRLVPARIPRVDVLRGLAVGSLHVPLSIITPYLNRVIVQAGGFTGSCA